jgi:DNA polymerase-3 subunit delta'
VDILESDRLLEFAHPRETERLIGHGDAEQAILDAARSGKMHHAWLITGPQGIGKATLAYRMARFLLANGEGGQSLDVPADHPAAKLTHAGSHPDLFVLRRPYDEKTKKHKTNIPVANVRKVGNFFATHASHGGWRIVIVDAADDMDGPAANALLKVLEEPPQKAVLILVSHSPGRLLPTIRSRCRKLTLKSLSTDEISDVLAQNGFEIKPKDAAAVAALAEGSAGEALALAEGGGLDLYKQVEAVLGALPNPDAKALHKLADAMAKRGADDTWRAGSDMIVRWAGRVARALALGEPGPDIVVGEGSRMLQLAQGTSPAAWADAPADLTRHFARAEGLNMDRKQTVMNAVFLLQGLARNKAA